MAVAVPQKMRAWLSRYWLPLSLFAAPFLFFLPAVALMPRNPEKPAKAVVDLIQQLPTGWSFWLYVAFLVGVYFVRFWCMRDRLERDFISKAADKKYNTKLSRRGWWATQEVRNRALSLRIRADLILGGVFALLFGGTYLIVFGLPHIQDIDKAILRDAQQTAIFRERYGKKLLSMSLGRYWVQVAAPRVLPYRIAYRWWSPDGKSGMLVGQNGSVFVTNDGGESWDDDTVGLREEEKILAGWRSAHGGPTVLVGSHGSVFVKRSIDKEWVPTQLPLHTKEVIVKWWFGPDPGDWVLMGTRGSVFNTGSVGRIPDLVDDLAENESLFQGWRSADGEQLVFVGNRGSIFAKSAKNSAWIVSRVWRGKSMRIRQVQFGPHGRQIAIRTNDGIVVGELANNSRWKAFDVRGLKPGERLWRTWFSSDGERIVVLGNRGSILSKSVDNATLDVVDVPLPANLRVSHIWLDLEGQGISILTSDYSRINKANGDWVFTRSPWGPGEGVRQWRGDLETGIFFAVGSRGTIVTTWDAGKTWVSRKWSDARLRAFLTHRGRRVLVAWEPGGSAVATTADGQNWNRGDVKLGPTEALNLGWFSSDGNRGLLVSDQGLILVTVDHGVSWTATGIKSNEHRFVEVRFLPNRLVAVDDRGARYLLERHHDLAKWDTEKPEVILAAMKRNATLKNIALVREIETFLGGKASFEIDGGKRDNLGSDTPRTLWERLVHGIDNLTVSRLVTLAVLFFLVRMLIRLYQYNLRVAAFWESRSDAVLLAAEFANPDAVSFDKLVTSFAPDTYDFNPTVNSRWRNLLDLWRT